MYDSHVEEKLYTDENELRLAELNRLQLLDSGAEKVYDDITQLTADICNVPVCLISLVDIDRQWFKSEVGLGVSETVIEQSICAHAVQQDSYLEIHDTQNDPRTIENTLCQGDTPFRFYAGALLRTLEGVSVGTLCVLDYHPRQLSELQRRVLQVHATHVMRHMEFTKTLMMREEPSEMKLSQTPASHRDLKVHENTLANFAKLTPREKEVLNLIAGNSTSLSSKQIATELGISFRTVHHHRAHIMTKMQVASVAELIAVTIKANIFR